MSESQQEENVSHFAVRSMPADCLALLSAKTSARTFNAMLRREICTLIRVHEA